MFDPQLPSWQSQTKYWFDLVIGTLGLGALFFSYRSSQAARNSSESLMKGDRGWVLIESSFGPGLINHLPTTKGQGKFTIELKNYGKTPVLVNCIGVLGKIVDSSVIPDELANKLKERFYEGRVLIAGFPSRKGVEVVDDRISDPEYHKAWIAKGSPPLEEQLIVGEAYVLLCARVRYMDIYERPHETQVALMLSWKGMSSAVGTSPRISQVGKGQHNKIT